MATRVIDDTKLQNIAVAIQGKDSGGVMTVDEMPTRIAAIPEGIQKSSTSDTPVYFGVNANGLYVSDNPNDETEIIMGRIGNRLYVETP